MAKYSVKFIQSEIQKCKDPVYFINNYCKILHPTKGIIPFKTFDYQDDLITALLENRFNVVLKARQLGISTIIAGFITWYMLFNEGRNVAIICTKEQSAKNLLRKVKLMFDSLPSFMMFLDKVENSKTVLELSNHSKVTAFSKDPDGPRSESFSLFVMDEAGIIDNMQELWTAVAPTISSSKGRCIALSTPKGAQGWFYETCVGAEKGTNNFKLTKLMWDVHPEHDQAWFDHETKNMKTHQIAQEFLCSFLMSGNTVISPEILKIYEDEIKLKDMHITEGVRKDTFIWDFPQPGRKYLMTVDVATGKGADYSAYHIFDFDTCEQVAEFKGKLPPEEFVELVYRQAIRYNEALLAVENNNIGYILNRTLAKREYPNLYFEDRRKMEILDPYQSLMEGKEPGISTNSKSRDIFISRMCFYLENREIILRSPRLMEELRTFIWNKSKAEASKGKNDDLVMALAFASYILHYYNKQKFNFGNKDKEILGAMIFTNKSTYHESKNTDPFYRKTSNSKNSHTKQMYEKYKWLF